MNRFHRLPQPLDYELSRALLSPDRTVTVHDYAFNIAAMSDDRPYFFQSLKLRHLPRLQAQLGGQTPAYVEAGLLMLLAALLQAVLLSGLLVATGARLRPLRPAGTRRHRCRGLQYFLCLGAGFMLIEIAFLQKLILYVSHPVYAAGLAIGTFLIWAGIGSWASGRWHASAQRQIRLASLGVLLCGVLCLLALGPWLAWTQGAGLGWRCLW